MRNGDGQHAFVGREKRFTVSGGDDREDGAQIDGDAPEWSEKTLGEESMK